MVSWSPGLPINPMSLRLLRRLPLFLSHPTKMSSQSITIPQSMRASVVHKDKKVQVEEIPVPVIDKEEILVKVHAVAQNPTDWKHVQFRNKPGTIIGCDFSGTVVQIGSTAADQAFVKLGDHVAGFVQGGAYYDRGAFAEYVKTPTDLVWRVPNGTLTHEEAATMGCALWTAVQALYGPGRLSLVEPPSKTLKSNEWVFINGGSTSVGQFAIQLAHVSGYKVVTTASPRNHNFLKNLGADIVLNYKSTTIIQDLKSSFADGFGGESTSIRIHNALDAFSTPEAQQLTCQILNTDHNHDSDDPQQQKKLVTILGIDESSKSTHPNIQFIQTLIYTSLGRQFNYGENAIYPVSEPDRSHMASFLPKISALVESGHLRPNKVKLWEGGLNVVNDGLAYMQAGNISGVKIVYRVPE